MAPTSLRRRCDFNSYRSLRLDASAPPCAHALRLDALRRTLSTEPKRPVIHSATIRLSTMRTTRTRSTTTWTTAAATLWTLRCPSKAGATFSLPPSPLASKSHTSNRMGRCPVPRVVRAFDFSPPHMRALPASPVIRSHPTSSDGLAFDLVVQTLNARVVLALRGASLRKSPTRAIALRRLTASFTSASRT